ncbi:galactokinase [Kickxella alabastrina]|uniref:Galactokinase n=1 Tax=Kickxella alabastrina TaxID=61397 RepID=A0ACC1IQE3_9FUNG|nr:galactokinase [Kickxella alabastrina]
MSFVPTVTDIGSIYSLNVEVQSKRYAQLAKSFEELYGSKPEFTARAPGRVNIIGEHIDYCGFPVFPMAIAPDTLIAVRANGTDRVRVANVNADKYPARDFSASGDVFDIDSALHEWSNYFKCGYRGVFDHLGRKDGRGFDALLDGTVPAGSGLSSSAAFVCATELAVQRINGFELTQSELASIAASSECHVGVNSGGMDQTASIMGQQGSALFIEFYPELRATPVKFPSVSPSIAFVIANTLVVSDKHVTAPICYNLRVVETRVGALILAKHLGISERPACKDVDPLTFKIVMDEYFADQADSGKDEVQVWIDRLSFMLEESKKAFGSQPDGYTRESMAAALNSSPEVLSVKVHENQFPVRADKFQLLNRALHAFSETLRVVKFRQICEQPSGDVARALGDLMNDSQDSCRDLFECSCPELDEVCAIARRAGAFGSRLTGAGWGGCSVHIVPGDKVEEVNKALAEEYYAKRFPELTKEQLDDALFATAPGCGACYYNEA